MFVIDCFVVDSAENFPNQDSDMLFIQSLECQDSLIDLVDKSKPELDENVDTKLESDTEYASKQTNLSVRSGKSIREEWFAENGDKENTGEILFVQEDTELKTVITNPLFIEKRRQSGFNEAIENSPHDLSATNSFLDLVSQLYEDTSTQSDSGDKVGSKLPDEVGDMVPGQTDITAKDDCHRIEFCEYIIIRKSNLISQFLIDVADYLHDENPEEYALLTTVFDIFGKQNMIHISDLSDSYFTHLQTSYIDWVDEPKWDRLYTDDYCETIFSTHSNRHTVRVTCTLKSQYIPCTLVIHCIPSYTTQDGFNQGEKSVVPNIQVNSSMFSLSSITGYQDEIFSEMDRLRYPAAFEQSLNSNIRLDVPSSTHGTLKTQDFGFESALDLSERTILSNDTVFHSERTETDLYLSLASMESRKNKPCFDTPSESSYFSCKSRSDQKPLYIHDNTDTISSTLQYPSVDDLFISNAKQRLPKTCTSSKFNNNLLLNNDMGLF